MWEGVELLREVEEDKVWFFLFVLLQVDAGGDKQLRQS